jgi:GxxExxY protein
VNAVPASADELNRISEVVIGSAIAVHKALGPGLLESAYEACLEFELIDRGLLVQRQYGLPLQYRSVKVDAGYKLDLLVEQAVIVELKSVEKLERIHEAQLLTYLKLSGLHLGLLMNFNTVKLMDGIKRVVHQFPS